MSTHVFHQHKFFLHASFQKFRGVTIVEPKDTSSARTFMVPLQIKFYNDVSLWRPLSNKAPYGYRKAGQLELATLNSDL
jgi:hypothetical protein